MGFCGDEVFVDVLYGVGNVVLIRVGIVDG